VVSAVLVPRSFVVVTLQRRQQHGGISGAVENVLIDVVGFGDERLHGENGGAPREACQAGGQRYDGKSLRLIEVISE